MHPDLKKLELSEYDYSLPQEKIAAFPLPERDRSRLLIYEKGAIQDDFFYNLPSHLPNEATLILNNTRVIEARVIFQKSSGAFIELFCLEPFEQSIEQSLAQTERVQWLCLIGGASKWKAGQLLQKQIEINGVAVLLTAKYIGKKEESFIIEFSWEPLSFPFADILHAAGDMPLPPYIKRKATEEDKERYQTIFNLHEGSVAAPTAALHFTKDSFTQLADKNINPEYITLHVGAGTFKPIKTESVREHRMHGEPFSVSKSAIEQIMKAESVIAVGTTSLRTIESLYWIGVKYANGLKEASLDQWEAYELATRYAECGYRQSFQALLNYMEENKTDVIHCHTSLMIVPGYSFKIPAGLITNFHQPKSTLLLLVAAFIGEDWKKVYRHASDHSYRFLSYGDSSLLWRNP
jgi:S-adenosylmethionine:tRNA ribosyltransferase-isomerase